MAIPMELYVQLQTDRQLVIDPQTGNVVRQEAWERIDRVLDCLNELNLLEIDDKS